MKKVIVLIMTLVVLCAAPHAQGAPKLRALIIDGQNNHAWKLSTPVLKEILESSGRFQVDVLTSPPAGADFSSFHPQFANYDVVISNYNDCTDQILRPGQLATGCPGTGTLWPEDVQRSFERYVRDGGGFVSYHGTDNAFPTGRPTTK